MVPLSLCSVINCDVTINYHYEEHTIKISYPQLTTSIIVQVVGMEGCFGVLFMSLLVLPVCYFIPGNGPHGSYENSLDAISQVRYIT